MSKKRVPNRRAQQFEQPSIISYLFPWNLKMKQQQKNKYRISNIEYRIAENVNRWKKKKMNSKMENRNECVSVCVCVTFKTRNLCERNFNFGVWFRETNAWAKHPMNGRTGKRTQEMQRKWLIKIQTNSNKITHNQWTPQMRRGTFKMRYISTFYCD